MEVEEEELIDQEAMAAAQQEMDMDIMEAGVLAARVIATVMEDSSTSEEEESVVDHRTEPRRHRRYYDHVRAYECIMKDYLGPDPLFGKEFSWYFRISRPMFELLRTDIGGLGLPFYSAKVNPIHKNPPPSLEAKLLIALKCLAYGVPATAFADYFQMSAQLGTECRLQFDYVIALLYAGVYLDYKLPVELKSIVNLHRHKHKVPGMYGSLDCMHSRWKNCPYGWQGTYRGAKKVPTLVLEAIADHNLFFHHASFGYPGTLNVLVRH